MDVIAFENSRLFPIKRSAGMTAEAWEKKAPPKQNQLEWGPIQYDSISDYPLTTNRCAPSTGAYALSLRMSARGSDAADYALSTFRPCRRRGRRPWEIPSSRPESRQ